LHDHFSSNDCQCGEAFFRNTFLLVQLLSGLFHSVN
jgi:hypothetical protein